MHMVHVFARLPRVKNLTFMMYSLHSIKRHKHGSKNVSTKTSQHVEMVPSVCMEKIVWPARHTFNLIGGDEKLGLAL